MAYIDLSFYLDFTGVPIEGDAFSVLAERASDMIDQLTNDAIQSLEFEVLHSRIKEKIQKATAAQVEFLYMNGGVESMHGSNDVSSVSIGNFSYSNGSGAESSKKAVSPVVLEYLKGTGFLYRGVDVRG